MTTPIIPNDLISDRATRRLITAWQMHHSRVVICRKRVNWKNAAARKIEKSRRREYWIRVAQILEIERTLLHWIAKKTKHPEIYTSKNPDRRESQLRHLERRYRRNRVAAHNAAGPLRRKLLRQRERIVSQKRAIERKWIVALFLAIHPEAPLPNPLPLHPRELLPRKLRRASKRLLQELS